MLEPLSAIAERTGAGILSVTHFSMGGAVGSTKALHRVIGSIAFAGAPRPVFAVIEDAEHEGRRFLLSVKNNLARPPQGLAFYTEQWPVVENIIASRVTWEATPVTVTADRALAATFARTCPHREDGRHGVSAGYRRRWPGREEGN